MEKIIDPIESLSEAVEYFRRTMAAHPERNLLEATLAAMEGRRRPYPCFYLGYQIRPDDNTIGPDAFVLPEVKMSDTIEGNLAREIIQLLNPLKTLNPVIPAFSLGQGTGTLVPSFGIPLNPELQNAPAYTLGLDKVLSLPQPDPERSGLLPEIRKKIEAIKAHIPAGAGLYIDRPDMQGPFNIAHAIVGEELLTAPYLAPEKCHAVLEKVTRFWIDSFRNIRAWIGPEWLYPVTRRTIRIAECSTNLVSAEIYQQYIQPYDQKIAEAFNLPLSIHTCSGPHIFHATLNGLPNILFTEAGFIKNAVRGWTPIPEALKAIGDRPIVLNIGQEIYNQDDAEAVIKKDFDLYEEHPRLLYGYTQMEWRAKEKPLLCEVHRKMDTYWAEKYG